MPPYIDITGDQALWLVFLTTLAARIGLPVPAAPLLVVVGGLAATGQLSLAVLLVVAVIANLLGDSVWFYGGRSHGARVMRLLCRMSLSPDSCVRQSESLIARWGGSSLIAAKFVPGISVVAAPMAGALGMPTARFLFYGALSGAIWSAAYLGLGVAFSDQIQNVLLTLTDASGMAAATALFVVIGFVAWRYRRRVRFLRSIEMARIDVDALYRLIEDEVEHLIIDIRSEAGFRMDERQIPGALTIRLNELRARADELPRDREIIVYCNCPNEASAAHAARELASLGFSRVRPLRGGIDAWIAAGRETTLPSARSTTKCTPNASPHSLVG